MKKGPTTQNELKSDLRSLEGACFCGLQNCGSAPVNRASSGLPFLQALIDPNTSLTAAIKRRGERACTEMPFPPRLFLCEAEHDMYPDIYATAVSLYKILSPPREIIMLNRWKLSSRLQRGIGINFGGSKEMTECSVFTIYPPVVRYRFAISE